MSNATPKFCAECGSPLPSGAKFCAGCGAKVAPAAAAADPAPAKAEAAPAPKESAAKPEPAPKPAPAAAKSDSAAKPASKPVEMDPLAAVLNARDDDEDDDALGPPRTSEEGEPTKKSLPVGLIVMGIFVLMVVGAIVYVNSSEERLSRFQCNVLKMQEKCITEEDRLAELEARRAAEDQELMQARAGEFSLNFSPPAETWVTIVQKRYEESRDDFVKRVKDGAGDTRVLKDTRYGLYKMLRNADGQTKGGIGFVTEAEWKAAVPTEPQVEPLAPLQANPGDPPAQCGNGKCEAGEPTTCLADCPTPPTPPAGPKTWWPQKGKELILPMSLQSLPILEREQADGNGKRLTAEDVKQLKAKTGEVKRDEEGNPIKDPATTVKTVAVSTWVYEIRLWAPGWHERKVLFYDDPAPTDLQPKKLEGEGWTTRKFKRAPDGKWLIDNASFDLLPQPRTIRMRYLQALKELYCLQQTAEYKGKTPQGQKDDEAILWEQKAFSKEQLAEAQKNETDPALKAEWEPMKAEAFKGYQCPKIEAAK